MVQAYNDWLIDYCSHDPSRLGAIVLLPNRGVDDAVAEIERVAGTHERRRRARSGAIPTATRTSTSRTTGCGRR